VYIEQLYTNCLAEAAYYIESDGEAAVIDPIREIDDYIKLAQSRRTRIKYILETHFHADFVSGHLDLAAATGATIVFGPGAETDYKVHVAKDGEVFPLGKITLEVMHTPGHTPESSCYLLRDEGSKMHALFSGDTLFVGDVGRPDLLDGKMTKESLAGMMYHSLHQRIKPLPDDLLVYPAHGPGSACGKNIGKETWTTLGTQKQFNYALQDMSREEFIERLTDGLTAPPRYYFHDAAINKQGYKPLRHVMEDNSKPLTLEAFDLALSKGAIVLDARSPVDFESGHIPLSINIGLDDKYAWWVGTLLDISSVLVIVAPNGREEEAVRRLARIGYENVLGFLNGGFEVWKKSGRPIEKIRSIEPSNFSDRAVAGPIVLDVRNPNEYSKAHIEGAVLIPLASMEERLSELDPDREYVVHCAGGYRSMIAASILKRYGFQNIENVHGGFSKLKDHIPHLIVNEESVVV